MKKNTIRTALLLTAKNKDGDRKLS